MTSSPAFTWSSYRIVPPLNLLPEESLPAKTSIVLWQRALLPLPSGVFFSAGMYQTDMKACAVARVRKTLDRGQEQGEGFQAAHKHVQRCQGFAPQCLLFWWHSVIIQGLGDHTPFNGFGACVSVASHCAVKEILQLTEKRKTKDWLWIKKNHLNCCPRFTRSNINNDYRCDPKHSHYVRQYGFSSEFKATSILDPCLYEAMAAVAQ